uniref:C2orf72-like C-terminal domain-containing protein n=1 Tax=Chelonoidis abingdonii TaxID=106734 RepID=A0A8C0GM10_CHEAB
SGDVGSIYTMVPRCPSCSDFQVLIEKVGGKPEVLLVGESQEGKDTRALMAAFVQELFPDACKPGISPAMAVTQTQPGAKLGASNSRSQLIFFLCRASSLRGKQAEIQKILKEVKKFSRRAPAALVGVIVQPKKEEETEARKLMESVLQGAFPRQPQVEVFIPGRPRGKLAIMKAACRASEALQQRTSADVKQDGVPSMPWGGGARGEGSISCKNWNGLFGTSPLWWFATPFVTFVYHNPVGKWLAAAFS